MMNPIKTSLTKSQSRLSKLFWHSSNLISLERGNSHPVKEEPDEYQTGGFHSVSLGDTFNSSKYTILRKLGYGQYSTVWLAKDLEYQKYVTLKILRADCYGGPHDICEKEILSKVSDISRESAHEGRHYIASSLDQFKHKGPNGEHVCLVFDVLGQHLDFQSAKYENGKLPLKSMKRITRQLLLGLDFLHRECGIIHTDVKPTNILLRLEQPNETISKYLSEVSPRMNPEQPEVPLREAIPTPLISEMSEPQIRIIDFGVASWTHNHLSYLIQPPALRAPEVTIGAPWGTGVDIWSLGCLIVQFVQGLVLFCGEASKNGSWTAEDDQLARIMEVLGPFPNKFLREGGRTSHFFDERGNLRRICDLKPTSLEQLLNGTEEPFLRPKDMPDTEVPIFIDFLRCMLEINPKRRRSAANLLQHEWIKK